MRKFVPVVLLLLGGVLISCGDEASGPLDGDDSFLNQFLSLPQSPSPTYGQFYVTSTWSRGSNVTSYISGGQVYDDTDHATHVSGGAMVANGLTIPEETTGLYLAYNASTFGATNTWSLSGNPSAGIPAVTGSMYVPSEIQLLSPAAPSISRSLPLDITWNLDPNNDSIMVRVNDITEPSDDFTGVQYNWNVIVPDNGSYVIPASVLANMPVGSTVKISLIRGNSQTIGTSHKFHIYGYTVGLDAYKLIP